jgi:hypothetical protein
MQAPSLLFKTLSLKANYWLCGGIGASLLGAGICVMIEAGIAKQAMHFLGWFSMGFCGLCCVMIGIHLLAKSTIYDVWMQINK